MSKFEVQFDPPLPAAPQINAAIAADESNGGSCWQRYQEFDTCYVIGFALVAYYPTAIMNVFSSALPVPRAGD